MDGKTAKAIDLAADLPHFTAVCHPSSKAKCPEANSHNFAHASANRCEDQPWHDQAPSSATARSTVMIVIGNPARKQDNTLKKNSKAQCQRWEVDTSPLRSAKRRLGHAFGKKCCPSMNSISHDVDLIFSMFYNSRTMLSTNLKSSITMRNTCLLAKGPEVAIKQQRNKCVYRDGICRTV